MSRGKGRSRQSTRTSERSSISRQPSYSPRQPTSRPPTTYQSLTSNGGIPIASRFTGRTPKRTKSITGRIPGRIQETREEEESE